MSDYIQVLGKRAKEASREVTRLTQRDKNRGLLAVGREMTAQSAFLMGENEKDIAVAKSKGMKPAMLDRLLLTHQRILGMVEGLEQIVRLEDPIGEMLSMKTRPNGLQIGKRRVSLGVVGIIYESRPNVTADAFGLCFKTGNVTLLRGGSDSIHSNKAIVAIIKVALRKEKISQDAIILVEDTSHETAIEMMKLHGYIDVLIPRGGAELIRNVVENSTVPIIETGMGNCHIYIDETADLKMAVSIIENAKTQRFGVCNACESLVIHEAVLAEVLPMIVARLTQKQVELRGDEYACAVSDSIVPADDEDWGREYLDAVISVKTVPSIEAAILHINDNSTGHSEAIITTSYQNALKFQDEIDAAVVYVNASTRFTDGLEFGFGAEIGISTQKLHARGPMGLEALTTTKYIVFGEGQIRG